MQYRHNFFFDSGGRANSYPVTYNTISNKMTVSSNHAEVLLIPLTDADVPAFVGSFSNSVGLNNLNSTNEV